MESERLFETLKNPMERGTVSSLDKKDGISRDEGQSKRCRVTVQHPEEISDVMNCDDVEKTTDDTDDSEEELLWLSENLLHRSHRESATVFFFFAENSWALPEFFFTVPFQFCAFLELFSHYCSSVGLFRIEFCNNFRAQGNSKWKTSGGPGILVDMIFEKLWI